MRKVWTTRRLDDYVESQVRTSEDGDDVTTSQLSITVEEIKADIGRARLVTTVLILAMVVGFLLGGWTASIRMFTILRTYDEIHREELVEIREILDQERGGWIH